MSAAQGRNCYITGAAGYLGSILVKDMIKQGYNKVYVPVRDKKGISGQERFNQLYDEELRQVCTWTDPSQPIPEDANVVILNAFSISFGYKIKDSLVENVAPILPLFEQCKRLPALEHVILVSTAYVQPPTSCGHKGCRCPSFTRAPGSTGDLIPFSGADDPEKMYQSILEGKITMDDLKADPRNHPHTLENAYVFSKTLLEHLVMRRYNGVLPVTLFRPSIISCSRDGKIGSKFTPPCGTALALRSPIARFFISSPEMVDVVFVDDVSQLMLKTVSKQYEYKKEGAPVVMACGASKMDKFDTLARLKYKGKTAAFVENLKLIYMLRMIEWVVYRLVMGRKVAHMCTMIYQNYDHFWTHQWDFDPTLPNTNEEILSSLDIWATDNYPKSERNILNKIVDLMTAYISMLRFGHHQNFILVIVAALMFPGAQLSWSTLLEVLKLYFSFNVCLYGALYTINGITDAIEDSEHPEKKFRPCAKAIWAPGSPGSISQLHGMCFVAVLLLTGFISGYLWWGTRMLPIYCAFIVLNLTYSFGMRNVKYCRFPTAALTAPCRLHLGALLTGATPAMSAYFMAYFFMTAVQSSKIRIENGIVNASLNKSINGWSQGTVEAMSGAGLLISIAAYMTNEDPLRWVFVTTAVVFHTTYNVLPYFNKRAETMLRKLYTLDCNTGAPQAVAKTSVKAD